MNLEKKHSSKGTTSLARVNRCKKTLSRSENQNIYDNFLYRLLFADDRASVGSDQQDFSYTPRRIQILRPRHYFWEIEQLVTLRADLTVD